MSKVQRLSSAIVAACLCSTAVYANEQSEAKGFVADAEGSVLLRNGWIYRDRKDANVHDQSSWAQTAIVNIDSGFTKGAVGFAAGAMGDFSFKIGKNAHAGNQMIPFDDEGKPYDQWTRGGAYVKARVSNTTVQYGTHTLDWPIYASNTARLVPEYFTGTSITSKEIKGLELNAAYFTKAQNSNHISTDKQALKRAVIYGAKYQANDQLKLAAYGANIKDALTRQYANVNYQFPLANDANFTVDTTVYHTKYKKDILSSLYAVTGALDSDKRNTLWALSGTYQQNAHTLTLAYQQNSGPIGYNYNADVGDSGGAIFIPNSYLSDFVGADEKSVGIHYSLNFKDLKLPGLTWSTAYVYGWDIDVADSNNPTALITTKAKEHEFFNQLSYTVQSGKAKGLNLRVRNSIYRTDSAFDSSKYQGDTNEWRVFVDFPWKLF